MNTEQFHDSQVTRRRSYFSNRPKLLLSMFSCKSAANVCWHAANDLLRVSRERNKDG
jgi:hypothetical protein